MNKGLIKKFIPNKSGEYKNRCSDIVWTIWFVYKFPKIFRNNHILQSIIATLIYNRVVFTYFYYVPLVQFKWKRTEKFLIKFEQSVKYKYILFSQNTILFL